MISTAFRAALILGILFASTGGTITLGARILPEPQLYQNEVTLKQASIDLETGTEAQVGRQLFMAKEQVRKVIRLAEQGELSGEEVQTRLEAHLRLALRYAAQLGDGEMLGALSWIQAMAQNQIQLLNQARQRVGEQAEAPLDQAIHAMERVQAQAQAGLQDPYEFRLRAGNGQLDELSDGLTTVEGTLPVGDAHKYGPQPSQPGPGLPGGNPDCPLDDCEPVGDAHQYGPQPEQPGSGQPGGNPDCSLGDCEPVGDAHQYGPQPEQPGPGQPGGNPECGDCTPAGDQNMNGEPPARH